MGVVELPAAQVVAIAAWTEDGDEFVRLTVYATRPAFAAAWDTGDVVVTQGDAHLHLGSTGVVREAVPRVMQGPR